MIGHHVHRKRSPQNTFWGESPHRVTAKYGDTVTAPLLKDRLANRLTDKLTDWCTGRLNGSARFVDTPTDRYTDTLIYVGVARQFVKVDGTSSF